MKKLVAVLLLGLVVNGAQAQGTFPNRPLRFVFAYPAGLTGDTIIRVLAEHMSAELNQPIIVENRPGASGTIGTRYVASSAPDGYTVVNTSNGTHAAVASLFKNPGYDPLKSFSHIGLYITLSWMLVARSEFRASNLSELVAYARANPGKLTMSQYSSSTRLPLYLMRQAGKFEIQEVPYQGVAQILPDLYNGEIQAAFFPMDVAMAQAKAGKVRILATASSRRLRDAPNVPAISEQLPGVEFTSWQGLAAPAGTPKEIIAKLGAALNAALEKPTFRERMRTLGVEVAGATPEQIEQRIRNEMLIWSKFVKDAGIQPQ